MSFWTHIRGYICVEPFGQTQAQSRYILETVLSHLPEVPGSEGPMDVHIVQRAGYDTWTSHDEFGQWIPNADHKMQSQYFLVVEGDLRDVVFAGTKKAFLKWLCRLAKRVWVTEILVTINGEFWDGSMLISDSEPFRKMFEDYSWTQRREGQEHPEPNWTEFLHWERANGTDYPMTLMYKYYVDSDIDEEIWRREQYHRKELK